MESMNQLDRIIDLVHRTELPVVLHSSVNGSACVMVSLAAYERFSRGTHQDIALLSDQDQREEGRAEQETVTQVASFEEMLLDNGSTENTPSSQEKGPVSLQDLLGSIPGPVIPKESPHMSVEPLIEALEDRFAFDGEEARILPEIKQKKGLGNPGTGAFGPTLA